MLNLDEFSRQALERLAQRDGASIEKTVQTASLYYLSERDSGRPAWRVPKLPPTEGGADSVCVELDADTWQELAEEAKRQGVTPDLLALHALLYFMADVDSGRVGEMLDDAIDGSDKSRFHR
jgi:hypothetical protein